MTRLEAFHAAVGDDLDGFKKIATISDETRGLSIYRSQAWSTGMAGWMNVEYRGH